MKKIFLQSLSKLSGRIHVTRLLDTKVLDSYRSLPLSPVLKKRHVFEHYLVHWFQTVKLRYDKLHLEEPTHLLVIEEPGRLTRVQTSSAHIPLFVAAGTVCTADNQCEL